MASMQQKSNTFLMLQEMKYQTIRFKKLSINSKLGISYVKKCSGNRNSMG
jgi:hypothetical protein